MGTKKQGIFMKTDRICKKIRIFGRIKPEQTQIKPKQTKFMKRAIVIFVAAAAATGCVTNKKYNEMTSRALTAEERLLNANTAIDGLNTKVDGLNTRVDGLNSQNEKLLADKNLTGRQRDSLQIVLQKSLAERKTLEDNYNTLDGRYKKLLSDGSAEAANLLKQLQQSQADLADRSRRIDELTGMIQARDQAIENLRSKISNALTGFENKGLTITIRNGQVYVSMDDKLLFRSGSYEIDPRGAQAVRELANVLAQNPDIAINVEGHTDDVPYKGSGQLRDNLDLSVKRATTVVRLLTENNGIDPARIVASGRGETLPIDWSFTPEGRARNRRTEIILSPKIDELMRVLSEQ
jgi:chemotaxis protein MotB